MSKNLKTAFILFFVFSAILMAWNTLSNYFWGVGINFVAILGVMLAILILILTDKEIFKRINDLFVISCVFVFFELIMFFTIELNWSSVNAIKGLNAFQSVISFLGLLLFVYISFRFICEIKGKNFKFIEIILGNAKFTTKEKKAKELSNGCLEDKPNNKIVEEIQTKTENELEQATENETEE